MRGEIVELPGRRDRGQRLLQRQPDVDAGGPPAPRRDARGAARGGPRHDGGAGPGLRAPSTARSATRPPRSGIDVLVTVGEEALPATPRASTARPTPPATPEEAGALLEEIAQPGDRVLIKGSRSVGLERVLAVDGRDPHRRAWPPCSSACSSARSSSRSCASASSASTSARRAPRATTRRRARPTMGGLVIFLAVTVPFLILSDYRAVSLAVLGTALATAARRASPTTGPRSPSAARSASRRAPSCSCPGADRDRPVAGRDRVRGPQRHAAAAASSTPRSTSATSTRC